MGASKLTAGNENVRGERVLVRFHFGNRILDFANRVAQVLQRIVEPTGTHPVHLNRSG